MVNELPTSASQPPGPSSPPGPPPSVDGRPQTSVASLFSRPLLVSKKQFIVALVIAAVSDGISFFATPIPPVVWVVDLVTAILLFVVLGWRWLLLPGLVLEAIPGFGVVPIWLLVVVAITVWGTARPNLKRLRGTDGAKS